MGVIGQSGGEERVVGHLWVGRDGGELCVQLKQLNQFRTPLRSLRHSLDVTDNKSQPDASIITNEQRKVYYDWGWPNLILEINWINFEKKN